MASLAPSTGLRADLSRLAGTGRERSGPPTRNPQVTWGWALGSESTTSSVARHSPRPAPVQPLGVGLLTPMTAVWAGTARHNPYWMTATEGCARSHPKG